MRKLRKNIYFNVFAFILAAFVLAGTIVETASDLYVSGKLFSMNSELTSLLEEQEKASKLYKVKNCEENRKYLDNTTKDVEDFKKQILEVRENMKYSDNVFISSYYNASTGFKVLILLKDEILIVFFVIISINFCKNVIYCIKKYKKLVKKILEKQNA